MRKLIYILSVLIFSFGICVITHSAVITDKEEYMTDIQKQRYFQEKYLTRAELSSWSNALQRYMDWDMRIQLQNKVASVCNAHGYYSEKGN